MISLILPKYKKAKGRTALCLAHATRTVQYTRPQSQPMTEGWRLESYVGLARNFKKRFPKLKANIKDRNSDRQTTLSKDVWKQRDNGKDPKVSWKFLEKDVPDFNPVTGICKLCTRESSKLF